MRTFTRMRQVRCAILVPVAALGVWGRRGGGSDQILPIERKAKNSELERKREKDKENPKEQERERERELLKDIHKLHSFGSSVARRVYLFRLPRR